MAVKELLTFQELKQQLTIAVLYYTLSPVMAVCEVLLKLGKWPRRKHFFVITCMEECAEKLTLSD